MSFIVWKPLKNHHPTATLAANQTEKPTEVEHGKRGES